MATTFRNLIEQYRLLPMLTKIIIINVALFVILRFAVILLLFSGSDNPESIVRWVELPSNLSALAARPWTLLTYMFAQYDVLHILFNMLWLYWFGVIFMSISTGRKLLALYIYGGFVGAAFYVLAYNTFPFFSGVNGMLIGASGAVLAVVAATAVMLPDFKMHLLFIGPVSLKWVAIATIALDFIGVTGANAGGHLAHLGGAFMGVAYAMELRRGHDITAPFNRIIDAIFNFFSRLRYPVKPHFSKFRSGRRQERNTRVSCSAEDQASLDAILDKIKKSGYTSLTPAERKRLFEVSSRIK